MIGFSLRIVASVTLEMLEMQRDFQSAVDFAVLHEVAPRDTFFVFVSMVVCVNVFSQVKFDIS